jgi:hypothetical protein
MNPKNDDGVAFGPGLLVVGGEGETVPLWLMPAQPAIKSSITDTIRVNA